MRMIRERSRTSRVSTTTLLRMPTRALRSAEELASIDPIEASPPDWPLDARLEPPPGRPGLVVRPRLARRLAAWSEVPVVALCAPAGYGKTTLLSHWADADARAVSWIAVTPSDDDPVSLIRDVGAALDRTEPIGRPLLDALLGGEAAVVPRALPRLARALQCRERPVLLVLDGVEVVASRAALDVLRVLIDHVPPGSQLALGTRGRLGLPTARLEATGRFAALEAADLRADPPEVAEMLRGCGAPSDPEVAQAVHRRTDGWPAAVYLAGLALREQPEAPLDELLSGDERTLADYFHEEVISQARRGDATFLRRASILEPVDPAACDAVLQRADSARVLRRLAGANLFVAPVDRKASEYRIHPLFSEALRSELRREEPELEADLHRRAGNWHLAHGDPEAAIGHALEAGEVGRACEVVWRHMPTYEGQGRSGTLGRWLDQFRPEDVESHPALALTAAWCRLDAGDGDGARDWLTVAERGPADAALPDGAPVAALVEMTHAAIGGEGIAGLVRRAARARELDREDRLWTGLCRFMEGAGQHLLGEREAARATLADAERRTGATMASPNALSLAQLALLAAEDDDWDEAEKLISRARLRQRRHGLRDYATQANVFAASALVAAQRSQISVAEHDARHAAGLLALHRHFAPWAAAQAAVVLARTHIRLGDFAAARALASDAQRGLRAVPDAVVLREYLDDTWRRVQAVDLALHPGPSSLTTAERRILQHLPTHLSFREIAERLNVSQTTVKTQALAVYRKLDVTSRSEAVLRAQELGLLDA